MGLRGFLRFMFLMIYSQYQHASNEMGGGGSVAISLAPGSDDYENLVVQMKQVAGNAIAKAAAECKTGKK